jgi:hypothetical protein
LAAYILVGTNAQQLPYQLITIGATAAILVSGGTIHLRPALKKRFAQYLQMLIRHFNVLMLLTLQRSWRSKLLLGNISQMRLRRDEHDDPFDNQVQAPHTHNDYDRKPLHSKKARSVENEPATYGYTDQKAADEDFSNPVCSDLGKAFGRKFANDLDRFVTGDVVGHEKLDYFEWRIAPGNFRPCFVYGLAGIGLPGKQHGARMGSSGCRRRPLKRWLGHADT